MEEENVKQESLPENEGVVEENPEIDSQEQDVESQSQETLSDLGEESVQADEVDSKGVPYKNRFFEMKRKNEGLETKINELTELVKGIQTNQSPKYTKDQLLEFVARDDTEPGHKAWALKELDKIEEERVSQTIEEKLKTIQAKQQEERIKAETFNFVVQRNPNLVIKDSAGNFVGWNTKNPLFQRMDAYMRNPDIANNPSGLRVALALAKDDLSGRDVAMNQELKTKVRTLQKQTLVEGGGSPAQGSKTSLRKAVEASTKGDITSGTNAMKEILKAQGMIKE